MAVHSRASIRYARALMLAAEQTGRLEYLRPEVEGLLTFVRESADYRRFLEDPTIATSAKLEIFDRTLSEHLSELMERFVKLLAKKLREALLPDILEATLRLLDEHEGRATAEVAAGQALSREQQERLRAKLSELTGKSIDIEAEVDADVVAGFVATIGDTVYDASLDAQLRRARRALLAADLSSATA